MRESYWDNLKFILIYCVVLGHCLGCCTTTGLSVVLWDFVYLFHIPLFVFISGRFSNIQSNNYNKGILNLFLVYMIFHVFRTSHGIITGNAKLESFLTPAYTFWYLLSLVYWRILVKFLPQKDNGIILLCSFILGIIAGFIPLDTQMSFQRTFCYLPLFLLGYYTKSTDIQMNVKKMPKYLAIGGLFIIISILYLFFKDKSLYPILTGSHHYSHPMYAIYRIIMYIIAVLSGILIMDITPSTNSWISKYGQQTMFIFLYHSFIIRAIKRFSHQHIINIDTTLSFILSIAVMALMFILLRIKFLRQLTNPITFFKNNKKS